MRQDAQKQSRKFCRSKEGKNSETHPEKPEKGETGCVPGAGEGCSGWRRMKPGEKTRKARRKSRDGLVSAAASVGPGRSPPGCRPPRHAPQAGLRAHLVAKSYRTLTKKSGTAKAIPDFLAGAEGLSLACRLGRFATERHWRSLTPRHAVLEWMWESAPGSGKRPMSSGSRRKPQKGRCWFGAVSSFWRRIVYRLPLLPSKEKHLRQEDGQADQDHGRVGPGGI